MDRDLVEAAQQGGQSAFVDLVRSRGDHLFAIAHRILRDVDRAEDALQDALVIAWRDLRDLRDPARFDAWVHRLLTNVCIAEARRERSRVANLRVLIVDNPAAPDDLLSVADRDQLDRGFRRLTPEERAILVLHHFVGYEPGPGGGDLGAVIAILQTDGLFSDPCHWDVDGTGAPGQPGDVVVGPAVDDLVAAVKANTSYTSSAATAVTFGQFEGQELELQLPGDDVLSTCDIQAEGSQFSGTAYFVFAGDTFYAQGPNNRWHLYVVDVAGTRLITMISYFDATPRADVAAAEAIVASFEITP
ncbi:MAG: RNA polymerase sigma factor [Chloroflexi bacterium]|nr:RNA polymerase sigma factor [Chloroflexota bacterium]